MSENPFDLSGKVIVVTGATSGTGSAIADACVKAGARVAAAGQEGDALWPALRGDIRKVRVCDTIMLDTFDKFGGVHGLVNCAADMTLGTLDSTTIERWDRIMEVNVRAPFLLMQRLARVARTGAAVVNIGSMSAYGGQPWHLPYSVSKGALTTLTKNTANGLLGRIRVNQINPGRIDNGKASGKELAALAASKPFGRLISMAEIARMAVYLLSEASAPMTGSVIDYDQTVPGAWG